MVVEGKDTETLRERKGQHFLMRNQLEMAHFGHDSKQYDIRHQNLETINAKPKIDLSIVISKVPTFENSSEIPLIVIS